MAIRECVLAISVWAALAAPAMAGKTLIIDESTNPKRALKPLCAPLRDLDPVEVLGRQLLPLLGKEATRIVAFRYDSAWQQVPVQVDKRVLRTIGPSRFSGKSQDLLFYADDKTGLGAAREPNLQDDDQVVLMYRDTGAKGPAEDPPGVAAGSRVELKVVDPLTPGERYVYLFLATGDLRPDAGQKYVEYRFKPSQRQLTGPNLRDDSTVRTVRYELHFSARWVHDGLKITAGEATGVNILDRQKFLRGLDWTDRTEETYSRAAGSYVANPNGPVRAVRSVMGGHMAQFAQRDTVCYEGRVQVRTWLRTLSILHHGGRPAFWDLYDFSPEAKGMTYYDNNNPGGIAVDGVPDEFKAGPLDWQLLVGKQGSLTMAFVYDSNLPGLGPSSAYCDDAAPAAQQQTGDKSLYAASGPIFNFVEMDLGSQARIIYDRFVWFDPPGMTVEKAKARATAAWFPLKIADR